MICQNSSWPLSWLTARASLQGWNLLSSMPCTGAHLHTHTHLFVYFQVYLWASVPHSGPVHHSRAPYEGAQSLWAVFHRRAEQPGWKAPPAQLTRLCPELGKRALRSLQGDFGPNSMSYCLSFIIRLSSEACIVLTLLWAMIYHKRSTLSQHFATVDNKV